MLSAKHVDLKLGFLLHNSLMVQLFSPVTPSVKGLPQLREDHGLFGNKTTVIVPPSTSIIAHLELAKFSQRGL